MNKKPTKPADKNASYDSLSKENRRLTDLNLDLHSQLTTLRESRTVSPDEDSAITTLRQEFDRVNKEQNLLGEWMRNNKAKEISQGKHMGLSLAQICIMYMAKGLE